MATIDLDISPQLIGPPNIRAPFTTSYKLSTGDIIDARLEVDLPRQDGYTAEECGGQSVTQLRARLLHGSPLPHTSPFGYLLGHGTMYGFERNPQAVVHTLNNGPSSFGTEKNHQHLQIPPLLGLIDQQLKLMNEGMGGQLDFDENSEFDQLDDTLLDKANHLDEGFSDIDNGGKQTGKGPSDAGNKDRSHTHIGDTSFWEGVESDDDDPFVDEGYSDDFNGYELGVVKKRTTITPLTERYVSTTRAPLSPHQLERALRKNMDPPSPTEGVGFFSGSHEGRPESRLTADTLSCQDRLCGVSPPHLLWEAGKTIVIKFLNGTDKLHEDVIKYASVWLQGPKINLKLDFVKGNNPKKSDVRILFGNDGKCSSDVGIGIPEFSVREDEPTMLLGVVGSFPPAWVRWSIQHEFGHMLGLYHEHSSPNCTIEWKSEDAVHDFYARVYKWSKEQTQSEVLDRHDSKDVLTSGYDHQSVMHYPVKPSLTANNIVEIGFNEISKMDRDWLAELYPVHDSDDGHDITDSIGGVLSSLTLSAELSPPRMGLASHSQMPQETLKDWSFWLFLTWLLFQIVFWVV